MKVKEERLESGSKQDDLNRLEVLVPRKLETPVAIASIGP